MSKHNGMENTMFELDLRNGRGKAPIIDTYGWSASVISTEPVDEEWKHKKLKYVLDAIVLYVI